ncbi:MAG: FAD:protein FMN transferase [Acidimicrobiales bacterium]
MNTNVHLVVVGGTATHLAMAEALVLELDRRWSRFRPDSDIGRINGARGRPVIVAPDTFTLIGEAIDAYHRTDGAFDPTVEPTLVAAGYDRTFDRIIVDGPAAIVAAPGPSGVELHEATGAVVVPPGVRLDLGGIGKGAAADLVTGRLLEQGVAGCCVNIGGDLRAAGEPPDDRGWTIGLDVEGIDGRLTVALAGGAACTSTVTRRRWRSSLGWQHHLRRPATGDPLDTGVHSVTVLGATGRQCEVVAKAAMTAGPEGAAAVTTATGTTGVLVLDDGTVVELPGLAPFLVPSLLDTPTG